MSQRVAPGRQLGPCVLLEEAGRGGSAVVYRARHEARPGDVAVKVIGGTFTSDATFVARFRQEAELVSRLSHPHILTLFESGEAGPDEDLPELAYLVSDYLSGGSLSAHIDALTDTRTRCRIAVAVAEQIGAALDHAHARDVLHRDIKPSNVLIDVDGRFVLCDFGLARVLQSRASLHLTATGLVAGTPAYMAPEQALGEPSESCTDLYGLAVVLYEIVTGRVPFEADTPLATMLAHVHQPPPAPRTLAPDVPRAVETVLLHALAKARDERYGSGYELGRALRSAVVAAYGPSSVDPTRSSVGPQLPVRPGAAKRERDIAARRRQRPGRGRRLLRLAALATGGVATLASFGFGGAALVLGPGRLTLATVAERFASNTLGPTWTEAFPRDGAKNEPLQTRIVVRFSHEMERTTVETAFSIVPPVPVIFDWEHRMLTIRPEAELSENTAYDVAINHQQALDLLGRPLARPLLRQFTTLTGPGRVQVPQPAQAAGFGLPMLSIFQQPTPVPTVEARVEVVRPAPASATPFRPTGPSSQAGGAAGAAPTIFAPTYAPPTLVPMEPNTSQVAGLVLTAEEVEAELDTTPAVPAPAATTTPRPSWPVVTPLNATATTARQPATPSPAGASTRAATATGQAGGTWVISSPTPARAAAATTTASPVTSIASRTPGSGDALGSPATQPPGATAAASGATALVQPSPHATGQPSPTASPAPLTPLFATSMLEPTQVAHVAQATASPTSLPR